MSNKLFVMVVETLVEVEAPDEFTAQEMAHDSVNNAGYKVDSVYAKIDEVEGDFYMHDDCPNCGGHHYE